MNEKHKQEQPQVPCENCQGTGKVNRDSAPTGDTETPASYAGDACPVCGGTGKAPAPTIDSSEKQKNCFVATVAFGDPDCEELNVLRRFRDERLLRRSWGRFFVRQYYRFGPRLAGLVGRSPRIKSGVRRALAAACRRLR